MPSAPRKPCPTSGCPELIGVGQRACPTHGKQNEAARGTPAQRGYGRAHQEKRKGWAPLVATGTVKCWRCGELIKPDDKWDLGHDDKDRTKYKGPEHANRCNRRAAGRSVRHRGNNR